MTTLDYIYSLIKLFLYSCGGLGWVLIGNKAEWIGWKIGAYGAAGLLLIFIWINVYLLFQGKEAK